MKHKHLTVDSFVYTKKDLEEYVRNDVNRRLGSAAALKQNVNITVAWNERGEPSIPDEVLIVTAETKNQNDEGEINYGK